MSQADLSNKTNVSKGTISMAERDITDITTSHLVLLCKALGVSAEYVLFGDTAERHDEWKLLVASSDGLSLRQSIINLYNNEKYKDFFVTLLELTNEQIDQLLNTAKFLSEQNKTLREQRITENRAS